MKSLGVNLSFQLIPKGHGPNDLYVKQQHEEKMREHFDLGSLIVITITFVLFVVALFTKGFTHDLLLEIGVFLVSVKLILMAYKNSVISKELLSELNKVKEKLKIENKN